MMDDIDRIDLFGEKGKHKGSIASRIDASGDCWEWTGSLLSSGYGQVSIDGKMVRVHRLVWEALVDTIPDGLELDHLCRNKACCNPDHLEPVTHAENMRRSSHPSRRKTRCPQGHTYAGTNLYINPRGGRVCRACRVENNRRYKKKRNLDWFRSYRKGGGNR